MPKYLRYHLDESNKIVKASHQTFFDTPYHFSIGYYWNILRKGNTMVYRHHGGIYGMQNWLIIYPEHQLGLSILTNVSFQDTGEILEKVAEEICHQIIKNQ